MRTEEVRAMANQFGVLKSFNLVAEPNKPGKNKGFAFFEYYD